jgi:uridine phosphorylase
LEKFYNTPSRVIASSELIINTDGSVFHLHLRPEQIADTIILVGDPARVEMIAKYLDSIEHRASSREFNTVTGYYKGKRLTILSTGIGIGNIDIVMTELDALVNIDFATRTVKEQLRQLTILRLGTSGALQPDIEVGDVVFARTSCGFDGLLSYYASRDEVCDLGLEQAFVEHTAWNPPMPRPYFVDASEELWQLFKDSTVEGITIASPGFYAPQGRWVRLKPADEQMNEKIESFRYGQRRITNYEMEGSAIAGLAALMGHRAATMCTIIAQRIAKSANTDYKPFVEKMIITALEKLAKI